MEHCWLRHCCAVKTLRNRFSLESNTPRNLHFRAALLKPQRRMFWIQSALSARSWRRRAAPQQNASLPGLECASHKPHLFSLKKSIERVQITTYNLELCFPCFKE